MITSSMTVVQQYTREIDIDIIHQPLQISSVLCALMCVFSSMKVYHLCIFVQPPQLRCISKKRKKKMHLKNPHVSVDCRPRSQTSHLIPLYSHPSCSHSLEPGITYPENFSCTSFPSVKSNDKP